MRARRRRNGNATFASVITAKDGLRIYCSLQQVLQARREKESETEREMQGEKERKRRKKLLLLAFVMW